MKIFVLSALLVLLSSCASLYKERAYVSKNFQTGECKSEGAQNRFTINTKKGPVKVSTPVHYDYWWTGPIVIPLFPITKERRDPSFIKISLVAGEGTLDQEKLLKSELHIKGVIEPLLPMNVVFSSEKEIEKYIVQFESPKLVDLENFRLKFDNSLTLEELNFHLAHETHYVPIVPVKGSDCVTD
ncbi:MAG: hypothetical protein ACJ76H_01910 [Bacteriovoracaceae bacterium]